jgi:long-chain acyl-CoA synthetase
VRDFIADEIRKCNASLPQAARVRRFLLLVKDLEADDAEITRTRKLRRGFIAQKYAPVIEALYTGKDRVDLTTEITYEDGRKAAISSTVAIQDIAAAQPAQAKAA